MVKGLKHFPAISRVCEIPSCGSPLHITPNMLVKCERGHIQKCYLRKMEIKLQNCRNCPYSPTYQNPKLERLSIEIDRKIRKLAKLEETLRHFRTRRTKCKAKVVEFKMAQLLKLEQDFISVINALVKEYNNAVESIKSTLEFPKLFKKCFQAQAKAVRRNEVYVWQHTKLC